MKNIFLFDVEAASLLGQGFAVGAIVGNPQGLVLDRFELLSIDGSMAANPWVKQNVLPLLVSMPTTKTLLDLRTRFYEFYQKHKGSCTFWSDVNFPVETNFLADIVRDKPQDREFEMPYPLYDVANFVHVDIDRNAQHPGLNFIKHHPLHDAMASYYSLLGSPSFKQSGYKLLM